ncbi:uncharacterized protein LOC114516144 [Dendronephthya gigantea]|uniref:uncharacterized protein LOC114516144 n=1 Tax=Dendronephthya gigantea TaxID=151771 RepID=UPI00106B3229|nr:uncharacterized protein LOC114516144 [Dendronephthya gigantea]
MPLHNRKYKQLSAPSCTDRMQRKEKLEKLPPGKMERKDVIASNPKKSETKVPKRSNRITGSVARLLNDMPTDTDYILSSGSHLRSVCPKCNSPRTFEAERCHSCKSKLVTWYRNVYTTKWTNPRKPPRKKSRCYVECKYFKQGKRCFKTPCSFPHGQDELEVWELYRLCGKHKRRIKISSTASAKLEKPSSRDTNTVSSFMEQEEQRCRFEDGYCYSQKNRTVAHGQSFYQYSSGGSDDFEQKLPLNFDIDTVLAHLLSVSFVNKDTSEEKTSSRTRYCHIAEWSVDKIELVPCKELMGMDLDGLCERYSIPDDLPDPAECSEFSRGTYCNTWHKILFIEEKHIQTQIGRYDLQDRMMNVVNTSAGDESTANAASTGDLFGEIHSWDYPVMDEVASHIINLSVTSVILRPKMRKSFRTDRVYECIIKSKTSKLVVIKLNKELCKDFGLAKDQIVQIDLKLRYNRLALCEMHEAIDMCKRKTSILLPNIRDVCYKYENLICDFYPDRKPHTKQQKMIGTLFDPSPSPPILTIGPSGSEIMMRAFGMISRIARSNKVLICTHSNSAADTWMAKILTKRELNIRPLRVYKGFQDALKIPENLRRYCNIEEKTNVARELTLCDIRDNNVFITTLATARVLWKFYQDGKLRFKHILIDEAAQALEPECLTPLVMADENTKVVLNGDQKQMGSLTYSKWMWAGGLGPKRSLLERLLAYYKLCNRSVNDRRPFSDQDTTFVGIPDKNSHSTTTRPRFSSCSRLCEICFTKGYQSSRHSVSVLPFHTAQGEVYDDDNCFGSESVVPCKFTLDERVQDEDTKIVTNKCFEDDKKARVGVKQTDGENSFSGKTVIESERDFNEHVRMVNKDVEKKGGETILDSESNIESGRKEKKNVKKNGRKDFLERTILDSEYKIKEEVHEIFKRFSWLRGAYGITGPNKTIPRTHIYLTVKRGKKKSEVLKEIKKQFKCDPRKYFELFREPEKKPTFKYLSNPTSGGSILAVNRSSEPNPLGTANNVEDEESDTGKASGTLTMFCSQNDKHYALTCFHVGCATDEFLFAQAFNDTEQFLDIQGCMEGYENFARGQEYHYRERGTDNADENENIVAGLPANYTPLGQFCKCCFHSESDIMSIQVHKDVQVDCGVEDIGNPDWDRISKELHQRVNCKRGNRVMVQKVGFSPNDNHKGYIVDCSYTYKYADEILFKNAIVIKGMIGTFLKDGDSGALISFLDNDQVKQAFAYGVCEVDTPHPKEPLTSDEDRTEDPSEDRTEDPSEDRTEDPSEDRTEDPSEDRTEDPSEDRTEDPSEDRTEDPSEDRTEDPSEDRTEDPSEDRSEDPSEDRSEPGSSDQYSSSSDDVDDSEEEFVIFRDESPKAEISLPSFIAFNLKKGLQNLDLFDNGCFSECGNTR